MAQLARTELVRKKPVGIAITLAQYLLDRDVAYELVPHLHTETALAGAAASGLPADSVVKAVVLKGADSFLLALLPASRHIEFDELRQVLGTSPARSRSRRCFRIASRARSRRSAPHTGWTTAWPDNRLSISKAATTPISSASAGQIFGS
jgi:hypothetical protein